VGKINFIAKDGTNPLLRESAIPRLWLELGLVDPRNSGPKSYGQFLINVQICWSNSYLNKFVWKTRIWRYRNAPFCTVSKVSCKSQQKKF